MLARGVVAPEAWSGLAAGHAAAVLGTRSDVRGVNGAWVVGGGGVGQAADIGSEPASSVMASAITAASVELHACSCVLPSQNRR